MTKERWSFDGHGINGADEYKSRIATLVKPASNDREEWAEFVRHGNLMATAPEMFEALEDCLQLLQRHQEEPEDRARFIKVLSVLHKAKGGIK